MAIAGDVMEPNLGISAEDEQLLVESNVTTVIHSAATIRFDEPLRLHLLWYHELGRMLPKSQGDWKVTFKCFFSWMVALS